MKSYILRPICLLLSIAILLVALCAPVSALDFVSGTNTVSESYKTSEYYKKLCSLTLTGDGRTDVIAVALSQLGYTEGNTANDFSGTAGGTKNYTEYNYNMGSFGSGYGGSEYPWCASFVSFCLLQAKTHSQTRISDWCRNHEADPEYIWREVSCNKWATQLRVCGFFEDSAYFGGDYLPLPGDLIYFTENGITESHIGIVLYTDGTRVYTVEGNTNISEGVVSNGGGVYAKSYSLGSSYIRGYGVLPYKVNNSIFHIDYSGQRATAGVYVSTCVKYVYLSETASTYEYLLPKNALFTVTETAGNGRLRGIFNIGGREVEGYIKNNSDRIIQISSSEKLEGYSSPQEIWGYASSQIESYTVENEKLLTKPEQIDALIGNTLGISGKVRFSRELSSFGYYFDTEHERIIWDEDATTAKRGLDFSYQIEAGTKALRAGKHTVHFVLQMTDGTICEIEELSFFVRQKNQTIPQAPKLKDFGMTSVTLAPVEGYEYKLGEGEWQSSNVFEDLIPTKGIPYLFYQRKAQTDTHLAGNTSPSLSVDLFALNDANKLDSLTLGDNDLLPSFDPNVTEYSISVPFSTEELSVIARAKDGAKLSITSPALVAGVTNRITVTVECEFGKIREYSINVYREEEAESEETETEESLPTDTEIAETESSADGSADTEFTETDRGENIDDLVNVAVSSCASNLSAVHLSLVALLPLFFVKKKED